MWSVPLKLDPTISDWSGTRFCCGRDSIRRFSTLIELAPADASASRHVIVARSPPPGEVTNCHTLLFPYVTPNDPANSDQYAVFRTSYAVNRSLPRLRP